MVLPAWSMCYWARCIAGALCCCIPGFIVFILTSAGLTVLRRPAALVPVFCHAEFSPNEPLIACPGDDRWESASSARIRPGLTTGLTTGLPTCGLAIVGFATTGFGFATIGFVMAGLAISGLSRVIAV